LTLCHLILLFLAEQTDRLRGEKSADHDRTGRPGDEGDLLPLAATPSVMLPT